MEDKSVKAYRKHTLRVMLMVFMIGSGMLFLSISAFSIFYVLNSNFSLDSHTFPKAFVISTVVILLTGLLFYKARESFEHSLLNSVFRYLALTLLGSLVFIAFQIVGWQEAITFVTDIGSRNLTSFVLALSGIHALHLLGGLVFLIWMLFSVNSVRKDAIKTMVFATEPYTKARLATLSLYWLYIELIWVLLFLLFYLVYW